MSTLEGAIRAQAEGWLPDGCSSFSRRAEQSVLPLMSPGFLCRTLKAAASRLRLRPRREGGRAGQVATGFHLGQCQPSPALSWHQASHRGAQEPEDSKKCAAERLSAGPLLSPKRARGRKGRYTLCLTCGMVHALFTSSRCMQRGMSHA